ncbi:MAG: spermidine synthase [Victivallaceae bacterium]
MGEWISEVGPSFGFTVETTEHLYTARSPYQQIDIYQTAHCGKLMLLDGIIQFTEYDEFAYQEMLAHLPLFAHPCPERVLVIGGGDGGILREIAKHDCVKRIDLCEIDAMVIEAAKKFVPSMSCGFDDPRVAVHIADGSKFVADKESEYDVIIVDSTDPVGPGESLFNAEFYSKMKRALKPDGVIASQSESIYLHPAVIKRLMRINLDLFGSYNYALMLVPTYPTGTIGASVVSCSRDVKNPVREPDASMLAKLRYYTPEIHRASFVLPKFAEDFLKEV